MVRIKTTTKYGHTPRFDTTANVEDKFPRKLGIAYPIGAKNGYYFNKASGKELIKNNYDILHIVEYKKHKMKKK